MGLISKDDYCVMMFHRGRVCTHTALVFFHRFFKHQDIFRHDRLVCDAYDDTKVTALTERGLISACCSLCCGQLMAATCVYLATKTEEKEKSCKLTAITVQYMIQSGQALSPECDERDPKWYMDLEVCLMFSHPMPSLASHCLLTHAAHLHVNHRRCSSPWQQRALARKNADPKAVELWARVQAPILEWRNRVIVYERGLLYTIKFDLNVAHPFKALGDGMKVVRGPYALRWTETSVGNTDQGVM